MPPRETNRPSDAHSDHTDKRTAPKHLDLLRLISSQRSKETPSVSSSAQDKGKGPASHQKNERAVGENGRPLEKLKLASVSTPKHSSRQDGMFGRGDRASTSRGTRAEDLARMSPSEQVDWCMRGEIAKAFVPDGDRTLVSSAIQMLRNGQIDYKARIGIAKVIGSLGDRTIIPEMMQMRFNQQIDSYLRNEIDSTLIILNNAPTISSSEASSSRRTGESRSPERGERRGQEIRSEGASSTMDQLLDRIRRVMEQEMKAKEDKTRQEERQKLQQELRNSSQMHGRSTTALRSSSETHYKSATEHRHSSQMHSKSATKHSKNSARCELKRSRGSKHGTDSMTLL